MKMVNYFSKETSNVRAVLLVEGDVHDLLLVPPKERYECPFLVLVKKLGSDNTYHEGVWTNVSWSQMTKMLGVLGQLKQSGYKLKEDKEYQMYLKLKKKFEKR